MSRLNPHYSTGALSCGVERRAGVRTAVSRESRYLGSEAVLEGLRLRPTHNDHPPDCPPPRQ